MARAWAFAREAEGEPPDSERDMLAAVDRTEYADARIGGPHPPPVLPTQGFSLVKMKKISRPQNMKMVVGATKGLGSQRRG